MDRGILRQVLTGIICNLLIIDSGLHEGWSAPTIPKFNKEDPLNVTSDEIAWIVNLMYVGVGFGSAVPFFLMDRIGRKSTLLFAALPKIASWIMIGLAFNLPTILAGRMLAGVGCGITYAVMPIYLGEIASKRTRGPLGTMMAVLLNIGTLMIYVVGLWVSRFTMSMIAVCMPIVFLVLFTWLPESSIFLARKNRLTRAEKTLQWSLAKENVDVEFDEIKRIIAAEDQIGETSLKVRLRSLFGSRANRRSIGIAVILISAMTMSGASALLSYQSLIVGQAGFSISSNFTIILTGCTVVLAGFICVLAVKFTGKRCLLLVSTPLCVISLAAIATFFTFMENGHDVSGFRSIPTIFLVIYVFGFGLGLNPVSLAYIGEIFSIEMKIPAAISSALYYAITTTMVVKFYQVLQDSYGMYVPIWGFTAITILLWIFIYVFVIETEGKSLEEIQLELKGKAKGNTWAP